jgi:hypothetical protein
MLYQSSFTGQITNDLRCGLYLLSGEDSQTQSYRGVFPFFVINDSLIIATSTGYMFVQETLDAANLLNDSQNIKKPKSTEQQINDLRSYMGFNISELAKILQVQRPAIYEWLEGKLPNRRNQNRLDSIYEFCRGWLEKDVGKLGRYTYRKITQDNKSLMELLEQNELSVIRIHNALDLIADVIIKTKRRLEAKDRLLKDEGFKPISSKEKKTKLMKISRKIS